MSLLATFLVVIAPTSAFAAGTILFQNNFFNRTVDGTGDVVKPAPASGTNVVCLTASGNTSTPPLTSCPSANDAQGSGKLRLTPVATSQIGGIFGATSFPTSSGLDVTFNSYQYGGTGADGLAFGLAAVDPANPIIPTTIGPSGASLGYAASGSVAGLRNAYLGVGFDVYGNFSGSLAQGSGCPTVANINGQAPGAVVVRGPGNGTVGYCGLTTTYAGTTASRVTLRATTRAASQVPVQVLINPSAVAFTSETGQSVNPGQYKVIVTPVGGTARTLGGPLPTVPAGLYPSANWLNAAGSPKQLAFGFFGSTGSVTDFHEISNVKVLTFNPVPQLAVSTTSYDDGALVAGDPVNYVITPSVVAGVDVTAPISVTQKLPAGVVPVGAFGTGWVCAAPSGQSITCTTSGSSFPNGTVLPVVNVIGTVTGTGVTSSVVQNSSTTTISSADASPVTDSAMTPGTTPTPPGGVSISPALGIIAGGGAATITGTNITGATAIEIGTAAQQAAGTSVVLLPCANGATTGCFTVSGNTLVIPTMPGRATAANTLVTVVTLGVAAAAAYSYVDRPATPAAPTATAGISSATVTWVAPANNGGALTGYLVTPYLNGVAQTPVNYDASTTTRTLTGLTPGGSYTFTVAATNAYGTSAPSPTSAAVTPYALPAAPAISSATAGTQSANLTWTTPANNGAPITGYVVTPYVGTVAQPTQTFNSAANTQVVTGLTAGTAYTFTVAAINLAGTGPPSARSAAVTPNAVPTLTFPAPPAGEVNVAYSQQLTVNNGTSPFAWSISSGALPAGLTLNPTTGLLSGTPTASGSFPVTIQVVDASGVTASRSVTLTIAAAPVITFAPAAGEVTVPYSQQPTLTGGTSPITWSIAAGSLPAGVTLNTATGLVSGTPTASGTFSVTIAATTALGQVATRTVSITIAALPTLTTAPPPAGQLGVAYSTSFDVTGGTAPLVWSIAAGSLPPGLTLNATTGVLSGTPTQTGGFSFTVRVVDAYGKADTRAVTVNISSGPLVITKTASTSSAAPGETVSYTITIANTSILPFLSVAVADPLSGVLDDATYSGNATASSGSLSYTSQTLGWTGAVGGLSTITITYSVVVLNPDPGNKVLTNTVTSSTLGTNCASGSTDGRCTATTTVSGLSIVKTASVATTTPGSTVTYTIVVTNNGRTPYSAATFTDSLVGVLDDATYNNNGTATTGNLSYANAALTWTGSLAVGASATITYSVTVANPDTGNKSLTGVVVSPTPGSTCPSGNPAPSCSATVTVLVPALAINVAAGVASTTPGGTVPYTLTISNTGQTAYTGASVALSLADVLDDAVYNTASASAGGVTFNDATGIVTWTGDLAIGAVVTVTASVTVRNPDPANQTLTAVAVSSAAGSTCPPGSTASACTSTIAVLTPALTIQASADVSTTTPGSVVRYTVTATNTGQTPYTAATFSTALGGVLDDAVYNGDVAATSGAASVASGTLSWTGDLPIAATATITYSVTVRQPDPGDLTLTNTVTSSTPFSNCPSGSADPRCSVSVQVLIPALSLAIAADAATTTPGSVVTYTVTATNTGQTPYNGAAVAVNLAGVLDDATYNHDASVSTGSLTAGPEGSFSWVLSLAPGATATGTLSITVNNPVSGNKVLLATVVSDAAGSTCRTGGTAAACSSSVGILVPGLTISKTANVTTATPGDTVRYLVTVVNTGETTLVAANFTENLATVLTDASWNGDATPSSGSVQYNEPVLSWTGTLAPGATATVTYSVTVKDPDPGDKRMYSTVVSTTPGNNCPAGGTDSRCTVQVLVLVPGLTIAKTADSETTTPGATVRYSIVVTNSGATPYPAAAVADSLAGVVDDATYNGDASATAGSVSYSGSVLGWTGNLSVGASATITYSVTVHAADGGDNLLTNVVASPTRGNNCATGSPDSRCAVTVPVARLVLQQSYPSASTTPGSVLTLTATFTNTGQVPYTGITVSSPSADTVDDAIPTGDQTATASWGGPPGTLVLSPTAISWTGSIPVGGTVTVTGTLTVKNPDPGNKIITGTLESTAPGNNCPPGGGDARCIAKITVLIPALTIVQQASTTAAVAGQTVGYTVTITNTGQTAYTAATVTSTLAGILDDATYNNDLDASVGAASFASPTVTWTGNLAPGAAAIVTYSVTVKNVAAGDKTMISSVSSDAVGSTCAPASGNEACRTTVIVLTPGLTIVSTADMSTANLGTTVTYTVKVTNSGQTPFTSASFTSNLADVVDDANFVAGSVSASIGAATYSSATLNWSGALAVGETSTITYKFTTKNPNPGNAKMANSVVSPNVGNNCAPGSTDSRCTTTVTVTNQTSVTVTNKADVVATAAGQVVRYTVTLSGLGLTSGFSVPLDDVLRNATWNNDLQSSLGTATYTNSTVAWSGLLTVATVTVTFSVTVKPTITGAPVLTSVARTSGLIFSHNCGTGSTDPRCTSSVPIAELVIQQAYAEPTTTPGSIIQLTATFKNTGGMAYEGITISSPTAGTVDDAIPNGDQTATSGSLVLTQTAIVWTGNIAVGQTVTITGSLTVKDPDPGDREITGTLVSTALGNNCGPSSTDARCTARSTVLIPALTISKTANTTFVLPGGTVQYTITIANSGQTPYTGATVTDSLIGILDDAVYSGGAATTTGTLSYAAPTLTWIGDLAVGATAIITYSVTANSPATGDKTMVNPVVSSAVGSTCPPASGAAACRSTVAVLTPALTIAAAADQETAVPGQTVTYTVTVTNSGQTSYSPATFSVPLAGVLDDAVYNADASATTGTTGVTGGTLTWSGSLAPGATATITYSVTVLTPDPGDHLLSQTVTSSAAGATCPPAGSDPRCSTSVPVAGLQIVNTADVATTEPTGIVRYTGTFTNTGKVPYVGISITDSFVGALDDATYNGDAAATSGSLLLVTGSGVITWTGDLPVGATVTVTGSVTVNNPDLGDKRLRTVLSTTAPASNCAPGSTDPRCSTDVPVKTPQLTITKTASTTVSTPGSTVGYTITIANTGETSYPAATVTDLLEGALDDTGAPTGITATVGQTALAGSELTWTGALVSGQTAVVTYTMLITNPDLGDKVIANRVVSTAIGSNCPSTVPAVDAAPACTTSTTVVVPALDITVAADRTTATPGTVVGYTITVDNTGQTPYNGAVVTADLTNVVDDADYSGGAVATTGEVSVAGGVLTWTGDLAVGAVATISYQVTVRSPDPANRTLVTSVSSADPGSTCTAADPCLNTVAVLLPGLDVAITADPAATTPGQQVSFTISITNTGETSYVGTTLRTSLDDVLDDASFAGLVTASSGVAVYTAPDLTWTGSLAPGENATITFTVLVDNPVTGNKVLTATVVAPDAGSTCQQGSSAAACTARVTVLIPALSIVQTADTATTTPGSVVGYRIQITNTGETPYVGAVVTDNLSGLLTDATYNGDAAAGAGVLLYQEPLLTWTGDLEVGATATITFSITVNNPDLGDKDMVNTVVSDVPGSTCPTGGSAAGCTTEVRVLVPALTIQATADRSQVVAGSPVTYTVRVTNTGETSYAPATFTTSLSQVLDDADFGTATTDIGVVGLVEQTLSWSGSLAIGQTATITYTVITRYPPTGDKTLTAAVISSSPGSTCADGSDSRCRTTVTVLVPALTITKSADTDTVVAGGSVRYTITATNTGESVYSEAVLTDSLAGVLDDATYPGDATASSGQVSYADNTLTWTGALGRGDTVQITYSVTVAVDGTGDEVLTNRVVSATVGSTCPAAGSAASCATSTGVLAQTITLTGLAPSFTLTGLPSTSVSADGVLVMTVTTNSQTGYSVSVQPVDDTLDPETPGNPDSIPIQQLSVRANGTSLFTALSPDTPVVVHQQDQPSAAGGDAVSNDYRVDIPFVAQDTYSGTLEYIATTQ